jgi:hypothetical protein
MTLRLLLLNAVILSAGHAATGGFEVPTPITVRSRSGQFVVHGLSSTRPMLNLTPTSGVTYVRLDPTVLAVSGENVKQSLLSTLDLTDRWQGRIGISLRPVKEDNEEIVIASVRYTDGWQYRMQVPEQVDKARLTKALVEVLLLEIAQRNAGERRLELPPWLVAGLTARLTSTEPTPLIVQQETLTNRKHQREDALKHTRDVLRKSGGLSLDQLNWPDQRTDIAAYEASAHLFVHELLRQGGGVLLSEMLARLRDHLNWQTPFLKTYHFRSLRDADKWWTLHLVHFGGQESLVTWSLAEVGAQLEGVLITPVQVRLTANELPISTEVMLQQILQEWDWNRQSPLLRQKLVHLHALRPRAPSPLAELIDGYRQSLAVYIERREGLRAKPARSPLVKALVTETIQRLNDLDVRRAMAVAETSRAGTAASVGAQGK